MLPAASQLPDPFELRDHQIAIELPGAHCRFTTAAAGDVREPAVLAGLCGDGTTRPLRLLGARQVHGSGVHLIEPEEHAAGIEADALLCVTPGVAPFVRSADCVPLLISAGRAVAAVHAGWRGLRDGVIAAAVGRLRELAPGATLHVAIGPAAGPCCYRVGDDVHAVFAARGQDLRAGANLDLRGVARAQLTELGVSAIHDCGVCTICSDNPRMHSYRRDGEGSGRQGAFIWCS